MTRTLDQDLPRFIGGTLSALLVHNFDSRTLYRASYGLEVSAAVGQMVLSTQGSDYVPRMILP